jgi:hypothetical protein
MRRMLVWSGLVVSTLFWICFLLLRMGARTGEQNIFLNAVIVLGPIAAIGGVLAIIGFLTIPQPRQRADLVGLILSCAGSFSVVAAFVWLILSIMNVV